MNVLLWPWKMPRNNMLLSFSGTPAIASCSADLTDLFLSFVQDYQILGRNSSSGRDHLARKLDSSTALDHHREISINRGSRSSCWSQSHTTDIIRRQDWLADVSLFLSIWPRSCVCIYMNSDFVASFISIQYSPCFQNSWNPFSSNTEKCLCAAVDDDRGACLSCSVKKRLAVSSPASLTNILSSTTDIRRFTCGGRFRSRENIQLWF